MTDAPTWRVLTRGYSVAPAAQGLDGDLRSDLLARRADGSLSLRASMSSPSEVSLGSGWQAFDTVFGTGDFSGDAKGDVLARKPDGSLWLYPGTGGGTFFSGVRIGTGWQGFTSLLSPATSAATASPTSSPQGRRHAVAVCRRRPRPVGCGWAAHRLGVADLRHHRVARRLHGRWERRCAGPQDRRLPVAVCRERPRRLGCRRQAGRERLAGLLPVLPGGDRNRDGLADLLALRRDGALVAHYGNGRGGWAAVAQAQVAGYGWDAYDLVVASAESPSRHAGVTGTSGFSRPDS